MTAPPQRSITPPRPPPLPSAVIARNATWSRAVGHPLESLSLQDARELRLLLCGESVIDWHRLDLEDETDVKRLLRLNSLDTDDPRDLRRLDDLRAQAARYLGETLNLRLEEHLVKDTPCIQLPLIASTSGKYQRQACVLLKAMHIIHHLDARELRTMLAISDNAIFSLVEQQVAKMFDELRAAGAPVMEFAWSRKTRESHITKLLVKRETSAARVFDRLRFRLIVEQPEDLLPTLHVVLRRCIPFNYVVPGQTVNTLVGLDGLSGVAPPASSSNAEHPLATPNTVQNEFSSQGYRILNFIADLPVRVDSLLSETERERSSDRGRVVFVLAEFQIMDVPTAEANERGESSHAQYKLRQLQRVRERLLREPKSSASDSSPGHSGSG